MAALPLQNVQLIILCSVFLALAIVTVGLRLFTRRIKRTKLRINDYLIIVALILLSGETGIVINAKSIVSVGVHDASLEDALISREWKTYFASDVLWISIMVCIKLSILHLYLIIFPSKKFVRCVYLVMLLNVLWWIGYIINNFTICQPFAYTWDKTIDGGHCGDILAGWLASAIINVILDIAVIVLPMPMLWGLQMQVTKKILISGIFGLGIVVVVISILRIVALTSLNLADLQYNSFYTDLWSVLEPCLAVVNASLPVMQPLYAYMAQYHILSSLKSTLLHVSGRTSTKTKSQPTWKTSHTRSTRGNDTRNFDRLYDTIYPMTERTQVSAHHDEEDNLGKDVIDGRSIHVTRTVDIDHGVGNIKQHNPSQAKKLLANMAL